MEYRAGRESHWWVRSRSGLTLVELLAVLLIVGILATLLTGVISKLPGAADRVRCTSNLKTLHVALQNYMEDHDGVWPQEPRNLNLQNAADLAKFEDWWIKELKPYGVSESGWQCPGVRRLGKLQSNSDRPQPRVHYMPTMFDKTPWKANQHATQPWVVETGDVHGHGGLTLMPDGSVKDWDVLVMEGRQ
jgi:prepilin-type N-terminal cleavage/methylation domain-containing protein